MPFLFERGSTSPLFSFCFPFPLEYSLLLIHDGLTACFAFSVDRQSGHSSTLVQEMPTSLTSPSLKSGMTHVSFEYIGEINRKWQYIGVIVILNKETCATAKSLSRSAQCRRRCQKRYRCAGGKWRLAYTAYTSGMAAIDGDGPSLVQKILPLIFLKNMQIEHFGCSERLEIDMLSEIDRSICHNK